MKKKIQIHELRKGMYVSELDRPWFGTPFLFQGFQIQTDEEIEQLRQCCQYVYIDTEPPSLINTPKQRNTPISIIQPSAIEHDVAAVLEPHQRKKTAGSAPPSHRYMHEVLLKEELGQARELESRARQLIYTIADDVRLGRSLDTVGAKNAVAGMVESVIRNPDALAWLTHLKNKDDYTALHSVRVCILALTFGRHLELSVEQLHVLGIGALLHDIGKLKVPNEILNKPGRLTDTEFAIMRTHVPLGVEILANTPGIPRAAVQVAQRHHERYSGTGYINGFSGDKIGLFGLIGGIVDAYDALTSDRAYHTGRSSYDALDLLYQAKNTDFHAGLVEQFIQCMGIYPLGSIVEMNDGCIGVVISINRSHRLKPCVAMVLTPEKQPYVPATTVVDLYKFPHNSAGRILEIRRVLATGAYGINPAAYLTAIG